MTSGIHQLKESQHQLTKSTEAQAFSHKLRTCLWKEQWINLKHWELPFMVV